MKKMLFRIALAVLSAGASFSPAFAQQNIVGTWQGSLKGPQQELRTVIKISMTDAEKLSAVFYSIDQRSPAIPVNTITRNGSTLKMGITALNGTMRGELAATNTIDGTWTQGGPLAPLVLTRATNETAWTIPEPPPPPKPMAADAIRVQWPPSSRPTRGRFSLW
jgi:hypothetical protein